MTEVRQAFQAIETYERARITDCEVGEALQTAQRRSINESIATHGQVVQAVTPVVQQGFELAPRHFRCAEPLEQRPRPEIELSGPAPHMKTLQVTEGSEGFHGIGVTHHQELERQ